MYRRILVPTGGSEHAARAAEHGLLMAQTFGATLHVVNVVDVTEAAGPFNAGGLDDEFVSRLENRGEETIQSLNTVIDAADDVQTDVVRVKPSDGILEYAEKHDIDLITMGTHGRSGIQRYIAGSVAERVVRLSNVPVLTVRATDRSRVNDGYDEILVPTDGSVTLPLLPTMQSRSRRCWTPGFTRSTSSTSARRRPRRASRHRRRC